MRTNRQSTRELMGVDRILDYGLRTAAGDVAFFIVKPTNIGVLPAAGITDRIQGLVKVIRTEGDVELMALNSWESFQQNKNYYRERMEKERLPKVREMLQQDCEHLDEMQGKLSTAREITLRLNSLRMDALEEKMEADGYPMEEYLQDYLIELYCKLVPYEKQKAIDAALAQEKQQWVPPSM